MSSLVYHAPQTVDETIDLLEKYGSEARILAGGSDLVVELREGRVGARALVGIEALDELRRVEIDGGNLVIGAATTFSTIAAHPLVRAVAAALAESAEAVGSVQIRNRGTMGGNLATSSPAGDTFSPLLAHEALVCIAGRGGDRTVSVQEYVAARQGAAARQSALGAKDAPAAPTAEPWVNGLIKSVVVPVPPEPIVRSVFVRLGRRNALVISRINLALLVAYRDGSAVRVRMALGAVGPGPILVDGVADVLLREWDDGSARRIALLAAGAVAASLGDRPSARYKVRAVESLVYEALERCGAAVWDTESTFDTDRR